MTKEEFEKEHLEKLQQIMVAINDRLNLGNISVVEGLGVLESVKMNLSHRMSKKTDD